MAWHKERPEKLLDAHSSWYHARTCFLETREGAPQTH
jgi:hypothetical protein